MDDQVLTLQIKLMEREASQRLADAESLNTRSDGFSDSGYLLELLAFEVLLKALLRIHGDADVRGHRYQDLFERLPEKVRDDLLSAAARRTRPAANVRRPNCEDEDTLEVPQPDYSNPKKLLKMFSKNFVDLRYPYENYEGLTEEGYRTLGEEWLEKGARVEDAAFQYYPEELFGLTYALQTEVRQWLEREGSSDSPSR